MKIRSIAVKELKKFDSPARITGINDHLNIISGPNEMGKSTILSALRAAFFSRHSSGAQDIKRLQNSQNLGAPVVQVEFDVCGDRYQIRKQFVKQRLAELSLPDGRTFRGDAAEDEIQRLIGFGDSARGSVHSAGMWNLFWVEQGKSFAPINVSDDARSSLHTALEAEVGKVLGGRRGRELPKIFSDQREKFVTKPGRERGEFKKLGETIDALREAITEFERRRENLSNSLDDLEQKKKDLKRLEEDGVDQTIQKELTELKLKDEEIERLALNFKVAESDLERTRDKLSALERERQERRELDEERKVVAANLSDAGEQLDGLQAKKSAIRSERSDCQTEINQFDSQIAGAEKELRKAEEILDLANKLAQMTDLESRIEQARSLVQTSRKKHAEAKTILVTDEKLEQIRSAKSNLEVAKATIKANATRISFDLNSGCEQGITVDGKPIESNIYEIETVSPIGIDIPERGLISVAPSVQDEKQLLENDRAATVGYEEALRSVNAESLEEAKFLNLRRIELERSAAENMEEAQRKCHLELDQVGGDIEAVEEYVKQQQIFLTQSVESLNLTESPQVAGAQANLDKVKPIPERLRSELASRHIDMEQIESKLTDIKVQMAKANAQHELSKDRLNELEARLTLLNESRTMADIDKDERLLTKSAQEQSRGLDALNTKMSESDIDMVRARIGRLEEQRKNRDAERQQLREETKYLIGHIESFEGAGIDEDIELKQRELHIAESEYNKIRQEVAILDLLIKTLKKAEEEAKGKFLSPILFRIKPYLDTLFPGADLELDENLGITKIKRKFDESFGNLSMGTQEQIAVLVRLTFALMLAEQGRPATVILDDALVFSDEERMEKMFDILFDISGKVQIVIFTCRKSLFEGLGGNNLSLEYPSDI